MLNCPHSSTPPEHLQTMPREIWFKLASNISKISFGKNADPEIVKAFVEAALEAAPRR